MHFSGEQVKEFWWNGLRSIKRRAAAEGQPFQWRMLYAMRFIISISPQEAIKMAICRVAATIKIEGTIHKIMQDLREPCKVQ